MPEITSVQFLLKTNALLLLLSLYYFVRNIKENGMLSIPSDFVCILLP